MLVFNCTKAAADFFTVTRQGKKISCIEPAPHKTIAESITSPVFPDDVDSEENGGFQWQWVVHCVSIKRQKYLLVMDVHSRVCITMLAGKKGDQYAFLNTFESIFKSTFRCIAQERGLDSVEIELCVEEYDNKVYTCAFHARSDRSVQAHINDVTWHLEHHCYEDGMLLEDIDLLNFNLNIGEFPRNAKGRKEHFFPNPTLISFWQEKILAESINKALSPEQLNNVITLSDYRK